jgi:hypothetical protein
MRFHRTAHHLTTILAAFFLLFSAELFAQDSAIDTTGLSGDELTAAEAINTALAANGGDMAAAVATVIANNPGNTAVASAAVSVAVRSAPAQTAAITSSAVTAATNSGSDASAVASAAVTAAPTPAAAAAATTAAINSNAAVQTSVATAAGARNDSGQVTAALTQAASNLATAAAPAPRAAPAATTATGSGGALVTFTENGQAQTVTVTNPTSLATALTQVVNSIATQPGGQGLVNADAVNDVILSVSANGWFTILKIIKKPATAGFFVYINLFISEYIQCASLFHSIKPPVQQTPNHPCLQKEGAFCTTKSIGSLEHISCSAFTSFT